MQTLDPPFKKHILNDVQILGSLSFIVPVLLVNSLFCFFLLMFDRIYKVINVHLYVPAYTPVVPVNKVKAGADT